MKHHLGFSALKVTVLLGALTVLLSGCTGMGDYRDKGYVANEQKYDQWNTQDRDHQ